jgi:hypothetical protein
MITEQQSFSTDGLPSVGSLLEQMEQEAFWEAFFSAFLLTVHPAEFAVSVPSRGNGQKEEALSAAFQRTFLQFSSAIGLDCWVPVLEAPVVNETEDYRWCDITFTPWVAGLEEASWEATKNSGRHVRIEVKWLIAPCESTTLIKRAQENHSRQHFVIELLFAPDGYVLPIEKGVDSVDHTPMRCMYAKVKPRLGTYKFHYGAFAMIVFRTPVPQIPST